PSQGRETTSWRRHLEIAMAPYMSSLSVPWCPAKASIFLLLRLQHCPICRGTSPSPATEAATQRPPRSLMATSPASDLASVLRCLARYPRNELPNSTPRPTYSPSPRGSRATAWPTVRRLRTDYRLSARGRERSPIRCRPAPAFWLSPTM